MATEPTRAEYERYFKLSDAEQDLTDAEMEECVQLGRRVLPWLYAIDGQALALDGGGLFAVVETFDDGGSCTRWLTERFIVVPAHRQRSIDRHTQFLWAILPLDEEPAYACSLLFEDGRFRRDAPERLGWDFPVWIYYWAKGRQAYKRHFGSEFPASRHIGEEEIEEWIESLNL